MSPEPLNRYIAVILRRRWLVLTLVVLVMLTMTFGAGFIKVSNNYRILFNENNPRLAAFDALEATYTESNAVLIAMTPEKGSVFTHDGLSAPDAVRYAFHTVDHALWTTTAVLSAGFLVFTISGFELT